MNNPARALPGLLVFLFWLAPACFALKTEKLFLTSPVPAASGYSNNTVEAASGRLFLRFKAGTDAETKKRSIADAGFSLLKEFESTGWTLAGLPDGMTVASGLVLAKNIPGLQDAEPDRAYRVKRTPDDPLLSSQYALLKVEALRAWEYETGSSSAVTLAVIDTGIYGTHPDLSGKMNGPSQFFDPDIPAHAQSPDTPACNHATHVAGVAAASTDNGVGIAGMSWGARLISLKVFNDKDCSGDCLDATCGTTDSSIAAAIDYARINLPATGKVVINMSLGSPGACSGSLQSSITSAYTAGLLLVAASGNDAVSVYSPANCTNVIPVGATDSGDNLAYFSNYGNVMTAGGLTAPGVSLLTTDSGGGYTTASGTSFSAPMVSGLAALIWSAHPGLDNTGVWNVMKNSADDLGLPGADRYFGFGRINAFKAMQWALNGTFSEDPGKSRAYAYPNPFRPKTDHLATFTIPADVSGGNPEIKIYTQEGELVKKLSSPAWDGKNEAGFLAASGVYIFYLKTGTGSAKGKFAVIR